MHANLIVCIIVLFILMVSELSYSTDIDLPAPNHLVVLELPAHLVDLSVDPVTHWQLMTIEAGQTLSTLFEELNIPARVMEQLLAYPGARRALSLLYPGTVIDFNLAEDGKLRALRYERDAAHQIILSLDGDTVSAQTIERAIEIRTIVVSGVVGDSLYWSARKAGLSDKALAELTDEVFKYDINFNTDIAKTDRFSILVEQIWREGELIDTGNIQMALITSHGKSYSGVRFDNDGDIQYYSIAGVPLRKPFIRMPVRYTRISSRFSKARKHPVLGRTRRHDGVDFSAPTGTPVQAAGNARIAFVGWKNGYGRTIILDHGRGYKTLYAHLSRFGKKRKGRSVIQGDVIGYVGTSGLATGSHLHYEFLVNGTHRNPMSVTMPPPKPLSGRTLKKFHALSDDKLAKIQEVEESIYHVDTRVSANAGNTTEGFNIKVLLMGGCDTGTC